MESKLRSPLQGAMIGFGNVAVQAHLPLWREHDAFTVTAVVETDEVRAALARELLPDAGIYPDLISLCADRSIDFVDICTPPRYHAGSIQAALDHGAYVFCEKPLVTDLAGLESIQRSYDPRRHLIFTVNYWKYATIYVATIDLLARHRIGRIESAALKILRPSGSGGGASDWRRSPDIAGGGILLDHGWHNVYLLMALLKGRPLAVKSTMEYTTAGGPELEETAHLNIRFEQGAAELYLTWQAAMRRNQGLVRGDKGTIQINDDHLLVTDDSGGIERIDFESALSAGSHHLGWMRPVIDHFLMEIQNESKRGTNFREASDCLRCIDAAYRSHRQKGVWLDIHYPSSRLQ